MSYPGRPGRQWAEIRLSANQTTNVSAGNHVEFDQIVGASYTGLISLATGAGQADGIITLAANRHYAIYTSLGAQINEGQAQLRWVDHPADTDLITVDGSTSRLLIATDSGATADNTPTPTEVSVVDGGGSGLVIKLELTTLSTGTVTFWRGGSRVFIEVLK